MFLKRLSVAVLMLSVFFAQDAFSQVRRTVGKDNPDAMFRTVQAAVDAARPGDVIEIIDFAVYNEQVTIDSTKSGITIRSSNPESRVKPVIMWRDTVNRSPRNSVEAQIFELAGNFERCGALRIIYAMNVTIDGIVVDGGGAAPFGWAQVWGSPAIWPLAHGNAAIAVVVSGGVVIRNCDLRNAYFGIAVKDRNSGGVFANNNAADIDVAIPMSGFGKTGNHLFEYNRIHNNSVGVYFESSWDLGSTVRYNLIYNNFHQPGVTFPSTATVSADEFTAGAISFKDNFYSPVAIYNNTFYRNNMLIIGNWQIGAQHLLFNNIFSGSNLAIGANPITSYKEMVSRFPNRIHNSVMSAYGEFQLQTQSYLYPQPPEGCIPATATWIWNIRIMNNIANPTLATTTLTSDNGCTMGQNVVLPGALIPGMGSLNNVPAANNFRWLQTEGGTFNASLGSGSITLPSLFQSINPESANFLVPNWDLEEVQNFIRGQGWTAVGMFDVQGGLADLGAIQHSGRQNTVARILPTDVVTVSGTNATAKFAVNVEKGTLNNATIKFIRWINPIDFTLDNNGSTANMIPESSMRQMTVPPGTTLRTNGGTNEINFVIPALPAVGTQYGFLEIVVEGTDANGFQVTTDIGFLPFRTLNHHLRVFVVNEVDTRLTEVTAGQPVNLHVTPIEANTAATYTGTLKELSFSLLSDLGAEFMSATAVSGVNRFPVYFTKAGEETVGGVGIATVGSTDVVFRGSIGIKVNPGAPAKVAFINPFSANLLEGGLMPAPVINPGAPFTVEVAVTDQYGNPVNEVVPLNLTISYQSVPLVDCPGVGNILTPTANTNPETGIAVFQVQVGCGVLDDWFDMRAEIASGAGMGAFDFGRLRVGRAMDRLYTLFGDNIAGEAGRYNINEYHDPDIGINAVTGTRVPVYVKAANAGGGVVDGADYTVCLSVSDTNIEFFDDSNSGVKIGDGTAVINLVNGEGVVWITSGSDADVCIQANAVTGGCGAPDITISSAVARCNIRFNKPDRPNGVIERGVVFASGNGHGIPDTMIVRFGGNDIAEHDRFGENWKSIPDTVALMWPAHIGDGLNIPSTLVKVARQELSAGVWNIEPVSGGSGRELRVIFAGSGVIGVHPAGYTSILGSRILGLLYWNGGADEPVNSNWEWTSFPVIENIGPIISARGDLFPGSPLGRIGPMIVENLSKDHPDTLMIQISEMLADEVHALAGASIQHKSKETGEVREIGVSSVLYREDWLYLALSGVYNIEEGDSIRFNPNHGITDLDGNPVQANNRYVELDMKRGDIGFQVLGGVKFLSPAQNEFAVMGTAAHTVKVQILDMYGRDFHSGGVDVDLTIVLGDSESNLRASKIIQTNGFGIAEFKHVQASGVNGGSITFIAVVDNQETGLSSTVTTALRILPPAAGFESEPAPAPPVLSKSVNITSEFTAGPNPVALSSNGVKIFRKGSYVNNAVLTIYDANGKIAGKVQINDTAGDDGANTPRHVGTWNLRDNRNRPVRGGTYLLRGTVVTADGKREKVSLVIGVR